MNDSDRAVVTECVFLHDLDDRALHAVLEAGHTRRVESGEYFFHQGEPSEWLYIIYEGRTKVVKLTPEGEQVVINYLGPGQGLGIIVALNDMDYPVSAEAVEPCEAVGWHRDTMHRLMDEYPQLALNSIRLMGERFTRLQQQFSDISTKRVEQRIARALLRLVRQFGKRVPEGVLIDIPLTRQDVAEMTGTNLYNVSRIMSRWEREGWIASRRKEILICKAHALVVLAEDLDGDLTAPTG